MKLEIDTEQFAQKIKDRISLIGKDGSLKKLVKQVTEIALLDTHFSSRLEQEP